MTQQDAGAGGPVQRLPIGFDGEISSLIGKVATLYVQDYDDPVVLSAGDQIEDLTTSLSRKTWRKLTINNQMQADSPFEPRADFPNRLD